MFRAQGSGLRVYSVSGLGITVLRLIGLIVLRV